MKIHSFEISDAPDTPPSSGISSRARRVAEAAAIAYIVGEFDGVQQAEVGGCTLRVGPLRGDALPIQMTYAEALGAITVTFELAGEEE